MKRKATKLHGTKKLIEGIYKEGDSVLVIEDLITSGTSILETNYVLEAHGVHVTDAAVLVDREQGGRENLMKAGFRLHSVVTISQIIRVLSRHNFISSAVASDIHLFLVCIQIWC